MIQPLILPLLPLFFYLKQGSSKALIVISVAPASSRAKGKAPEISVANATYAVETSPLRATGTNRLKQPEGLYSRSPLAPLFTEGLPVPYVPKWNITTSTIVGTQESARDYMNHVVPPLHRFMNFALDPDLFDDQYCMSICEGFFRGAGMLQRVNELRGINEGLQTELKTSQHIVAELRCRVIDAERKLLEEKVIPLLPPPSFFFLYEQRFFFQNAEALLEQREKAWERERRAWMDEKEDLVAELMHYKELASISRADVDILYADWGIAMEDNQKLARECHWLISEGFGLLLSTFSKSEEFKGSLARR
ncbi:hypothetical protein HanPI659440_Chr15g0585671 [Helianthus annuus]|nr:hypothetical protein HanPI659440_Chr15g0585671 [Helianthus annuus]